MDTDTRLPLANRIHLLLRRELGQGIDVHRMLAEPLYARDVLLVCDALTGTELALLAQQFRGTLAQTTARTDDGLPSNWPNDSSGFGMSQPPAPNTDLRMPPSGGRPAPRRWLSPTRWLGRD